LIVFIDNIGGDFAIDDAAEDGVGHRKLRFGVWGGCV
jgi:hypothetical protein